MLYYYMFRSIALSKAFSPCFSAFPALAALTFALSAASSDPAHAQSAGVEVRAWRNTEAARAADQRATQERAHGHSHAQGHAQGHAHGGAEHGVETENVFGFTLGSDTEHEGASGVAVESVARFGKRGGAYAAVGQKLEFAYGVTDSLSMSAALLGDYHRVRPRGDDERLETVAPRYLFNGFGGEVRYRFLDRRNNLFGLTLHIEPAVAFSDEASGLRGRKYGAESKLIFDRELVPERLFLAFNLLHEIERMKERGAPEIERGVKAGASLALAYQVLPNVFIGAEARYMRAYEGYRFNAYLGDAWHAGPMLSARINEKYWFSLAYGGLVGGREKGAEARLDLANFERHQVRLKFGYEF